MQYSDDYVKFITKSLNKCSTILENPSVEGYKKLNQELDQIISYSKLEDHSNIQIITEKVKYIVDSLVTGHKLTNQILDLLNKCLRKIKEDITIQNHILDLNFVEEIKTIYDTIKKNEKDFIYSKNLKVLLITNDQFLSNLILNSVDSSIEIQTIENYSKAFDLVKNNGFDIIICDVTEDNFITEDFILTYSKTIPIAIFYRSRDLQLVLKTAKLGVRNVISSDEMAIKYLVKTLHTIYAEWEKQKKKIMLKPLLEDPNTKILVRDMLLTELPIVQKVRSHLTNEINVNSAIRDSYDLKVNDLIVSNSSLIDSLVKENFLIKEKVKNALTCPNCHAVDLDINYQCISCHDELFTKYDEVMVHQTCGFTGLRQDFIIGNNSYCPKCNKKISNSNEIIKKASYRCQKCLKFFEEPYIFYSCNFCNYGPFVHINGRTQPIYKYNINPKFEREFKKNFFILQKLSDYLIKLDYKLSFNEKADTNIATETFFDLVARKEEQTIIFVIFTSNLEYNIELLYNIETFRGHSTKVNPIVISLNEPDQLLVNILLKFNIFLIVSDNDGEILSKTKEYLSRV